MVAHGETRAGSTRGGDGGDAASTFDAGAGPESRAFTCALGVEVVGPHHHTRWVGGWCMGGWVGGWVGLFMKEIFLIDNNAKME